MNSRIASAAQLAARVLLADVVALAAAYGVWRFALPPATGAAALRAELLLAVATLFGAALLLRRMVYSVTSWEPSLPEALAAVIATPVFGGALLRSALAGERASRPQPAGVALAFRTSASRMGTTKRLSDL